MTQALEVSEYDSYLVGYQRASVATEVISATLNAGQSVILAGGLTAVLAAAALSGATAMTAGDLVRLNSVMALRQTAICRTGTCCCCCPCACAAVDLLRHGVIMELKAPHALCATRNCCSQRKATTATRNNSSLPSGSCCNCSMFPRALFRSPNQKSGIRCCTDVLIFAIPYRYTLNPGIIRVRRGWLWRRCWSRGSCCSCGARCSSWAGSTASCARPWWTWTPSSR